ncbi:hypothetical protein [Botryobacter ruber]|uniref:hypothetical protein n=1 Tax=Botryobacter ruber TaxID=2171629 RepID=UPI000E0B0636|nr:hypothetical protein [Botryobacter ruber]
MILLADSGSTKTDWRVIDANSDQAQLLTTGINPHYLDAGQIYAILKNELLPNLQGFTPAVIYYYGAGCSSLERSKRVEEALHSAFPASLVQVEHDLLAAARALCGHQRGIACILGTGSNSCLYDGKNIVDSVPSLGFLMGDEGSGAYLGKMLIRAYLYRELPDELAQSLKNRYNLTKDGIMEAVYGSAMPGTYLATFAKFIFEKRKNPAIRAMIYESFSDFFESQVCKYDGFDDVPVHFTGSVAYHFAEELRRIAKKYGLQVGSIVQSPTEGLIKYHQELLNQEKA